MSLTRFALDRYQFTVVVLVLLAALGISSYVSMPRSEDPQFSFPSASVIAVFPGASPMDVEQLVVDPLEEAIYELKDLKHVKSVIRDGVGLISIEFIQGTDPDDAFSDVESAVKNVERTLPDELAALRVQQMSPTDVNSLQLALLSPSASYAELRRQAERLEMSLERISGVKRAETWGYPEEEIHVNLDFERLRATGIPFGQIVQKIRGAGSNMPGGDLDLGGSRFNVKTSGNFESLDTIRRTVVAGTGLATVYLDDVADISTGYADESHRVRVDGTRAVFVTLVQREGTNIHKVTKAARAVIEAFADRLPDEIRIETVFDQSVSVRKRVSGFFLNLLQGMILVGLIVFLALGFRSSTIVMLAIPFSLFIAIGWLDFSDYGLQQMSIVGLIIALGLLVDNAIVVTENIERFHSRGLSPLDAALQGTGQVAWPIMSATATTVLAFLPMVLLRTSTGDFIRSMPLMVIYALVASLIVSLTLTPLLMARSRGVSNQTRQPKTTRFARQLTRFVDGPYGRLLSGALRRPGLVIVAAVLVFAGSMTLFPLVGVSLFPKAEKPQLLINIDLPEGASLDHTDAVAVDVENVLSGVDGISGIATNIGHGNPRVYYNAFPKSESSTHAQLFAQLMFDDHDRTSTLVGELRSRLAHIPGARIQVKEFVQGPPVDAAIAISVIGDNLQTLRSEAARVESILRETPGTINVDNPSSRFRTDLRVEINRDKAGLLGVGMNAIDLAVRAGLAGIPVSTFRDRDGTDYDVVVRMPNTGRPSVDQFDHMHVTSAMGTAVPIRQIASLGFESSPSLIEHRDRKRVAKVTADVSAGVNVATTTAAVLKQLDAAALPPGFHYHIGGEEESRDESFGGMGQALLIALLGIFAVLVLQFGSFRQPLIVFAAIPFAITGAILALLLSGYTFSFTAFVGLTSLVGIVVNNSIILVDYANHLRREGRDVIEAIRSAGQTRFVPIILTTLTTIGGLLPLTLTGSTMWSPLGWAIIGGLIVSTALTLFVVPSLYLLLTPPTDQRLD